MCVSLAEEFARKSSKRQSGLITAEHGELNFSARSRLRGRVSGNFVPDFAFIRR